MPRENIEWISRGSLSEEQRAALPWDLQSYYDMGRLLAGNEQGVLTWIVEQLGDLWYGEIVGPLFSESVLAGWARFDPQQYVPPIA